MSLFKNVDIFLPSILQHTSLLHRSIYLSFKLPRCSAPSVKEDSCIQRARVHLIVHAFIQQMLAELPIVGTGVTTVNKTD